MMGGTELKVRGFQQLLQPDNTYEEGNCVKVSRDGGEWQDMSWVCED